MTVPDVAEAIRCLASSELDLVVPTRRPMVRPCTPLPAVLADLKLEYQSSCQLCKTRSDRYQADLGIRARASAQQLEFLSACAEPESPMPPCRHARTLPWQHHAGEVSISLAPDGACYSGQ